MFSRDAGRTWIERAPPAPLLDLAVNPSDPARLVARARVGSGRPPTRVVHGRAGGALNGRASWHGLAPGSSISHCRSGWCRRAQTEGGDGPTEAMLVVSLLLSSRTRRASSTSRSTTEPSSAPTMAGARGRSARHPELDVAFTLWRLQATLATGERERLVRWARFLAWSSLALDDGGVSSPLSRASRQAASRSSASASTVQSRAWRAWSSSGASGAPERSPRRPKDAQARGRAFFILALRRHRVCAGARHRPRGRNELGRDGTYRGQRHAHARVQA